MNNIILGFNEKENTTIELLLRQLNFVVHSKHSNFNDILRLESELYSPIIITKEKLKDGYIFDFLNYTSKSCEHIIISSNQQQYEDFIYKTICLDNHIKKSQMSLALNLVTKFNSLKISNYKSIGSENDYEKAKSILMSNFNFTENYAHRFIQKRCMNMGVKRDLISEIIFNSI